MYWWQEWTVHKSLARWILSFIFFFSFLFVVFPFRFPLSFHVWEYLVGGSIAFLDLLLPFCMVFFPSFRQSVIVALYFEISIGKLLLFLSFPEHIPNGDMTHPAYQKPDSQGTNRNDVEENMQYTREAMRRTGPQNQTPAIRLGRIEQQLAEQKQSGASKQGSGSTNPLSNQNTGICPRRGGRLVTWLTDWLIGKCWFDGRKRDANTIRRLPFLTRTVKQTDMMTSTALEFFFQMKRNESAWKRETHETHAQVYCIDAG